MVVAIALAAAGTGVAIVKPGDLGDDTKTETADPGPDMSTDDTDDDDDPVIDDDPAISSPDADDDADADTSSSSTTGSTSSSTSAPATSETTTSETTGPETTTTSAPGGQSGFDADGPAQPSDTSDGLADTGGETMILAGAALAVAAVALRRRSDAA